jgi:hypothetical protein
VSDNSANESKRQRRFIQLIVAAGLIGAVVLALAMTNTLSAFVATITNSQNTAATGTVVLQESGTSGTTVCNSTDSTGGISTNSSTCTSFNKYGGSTTLVPSNATGTTNNSVTTVNFKNTGTAAATSFTMAFGPCTQSNNGTTNNGSATDYCSKLHVKVTSGATVVQADTVASTLANTTVNLPSTLVPAVASGSTIPFTFTVYLDSSAGNTYQGLSGSQPITWTLSS